MALWTAYLSALLIIITTAVIYPIAILTADGEETWVHVSGLLNGGCSDSVGVLVAAGIGNFGYGIAIAYLAESFRRVFWRDDNRAKYYAGLGSALAFYLILGFPTGHSVGTDVVHHVSTGIAVAMLFVYAVWSLDRRRKPIALLQNLSTLAMLLSAIALLVTYLVGEIDRVGWNGFVAAQLAYAISFLVFLMSWGALRSGPDRPTKRRN